MPVGGQLRTDRTTGKHADHKITNLALGLPRLRPFSLANETPEARAIGARMGRRRPLWVDSVEKALSESPNDDSFSGEIGIRRIWVAAVASPRWL
jgi:hypothetical protein